MFIIGNLFKGHKAESFAFFLQTRLTCLVLLVISGFIGLKQLLETPIVCTPNVPSDEMTKLITSYCYAQSTHASTFENQKVDEANDTNKDYYQYVIFVTIIQAILFIVPHKIWLHFDNHFLDRYLRVIDESVKDNASDGRRSEEGVSWSKDLKYERAGEYITKRLGSNTYVRNYILCEIFSVANVIIQAILLEVFLHGHFLRLGRDFVAHIKNVHHSDPFTTFPISTECFFSQIGSAGTVDVINASCVLTYNALYARVFMFMWWWFAFLCGMSALHLCHLFLCAACPSYRKVTVTASNFWTDTVHSAKDFKELAVKGSLGDWFVLSCIRKSVDGLIFAELMQEINATRKKSNFSDIPCDSGLNNTIMKCNGNTIMEVNRQSDDKSDREATKAMMENSGSMNAVGEERHSMSLQKEEHQLALIDFNEPDAGNAESEESGSKSADVELESDKLISEAVDETKEKN